MEIHGKTNYVTLMWPFILFFSFPPLIKLVLHFLLFCNFFIRPPRRFRTPVNPIYNCRKGTHPYIKKG